MTPALTEVARDLVLHDAGPPGMPPPFLVIGVALDGVPLRLVDLSVEVVDRLLLVTVRLLSEDVKVDEAAHEVRLVGGGGRLTRPLLCPQPLPGEASPIVRHEAEWGDVRSAESDEPIYRYQITPAQAEVSFWVASLTTLRIGTPRSTT